MSKMYILDRYRPLRVEEREAAEKAILWLKKKHLKIEEIYILSERNLDRNTKHINIKREGKIVDIWKHIDYENSPLDLYLTEVFPNLKSNRFIFVKWAFTGKRPELCQQIPIDDVSRIVDENRKSILTLAQSFDRMKVAKVNLHIRN